MSFARILRSSALMGGAQVVVLVVGFARTKLIALVLGASGVGLAGIFNSFSGSINSFAGWGLGTSGVRLIASSTDRERALKSAAVRQLGWTLSLVGMTLALALFWPVSWWTFNSNKYILELAIVGMSVPCLIASGAWSALLQANGKIESLAKVQILGALAGVLVGLPLIYLYGTVGIAISIFLAAAWPAALLWRSSLKHCPSGKELVADKADIRALISLGGALMLVGWASQLSTYLVRMAIIRIEGLDAAGYYHAAFAISGSLPGFVFAAMGADFFPRVAAAEGEENALVATERQIVVGLVLATPLVGVLLLFGDEIIALLFAESFFPANQPLAWLTWGIFFRLIAWPLGYWMIARSSSRAVVAIECGAAITLVVLQAWLTNVSGLAGAGAGFLLGYILYAVSLAIFARYKAGRWLSKSCVMFALATTMILAAGQLALHDTPKFHAKAAFIATLVLWSIVSYAVMKKHED
jgi:PST family polysaccharide transporter